MTSETDETNEDPRPAIKALFQQLTTLILGYPKSGNDVMTAILMVGGWCSVVFASLALMLEQKDKERTIVTIDRITESLNRDVKKQLTLLRGLKSAAKKSGLILPKEKEIIT